jgi:hypothetical protein
MLTDRGLGVGLFLKFDHACASGATVGLVLDLSTLDLADGSEELD